MNDRSGSVRICHGKGLKARDVPLNATVRRALKQHLDQCQAPGQDAALFVSSRETAMRPCRNLAAKSADLESVSFQWFALHATGLSQDWGSKRSRALSAMVFGERSCFVLDTG